MKLDNLTKISVSQLENKNQFVISYYNDKNELMVCFQSYKSLIAIYNYATRELALNGDKWDYSKTTMKHLKVFINKYTHFTYDSKTQFMFLIKTNGFIELFYER